MNVSDTWAHVGRFGRVMLVLLQVIAFLVAAGALALGVAQAVLAIVGERIAIAYPVWVGIPPDNLLSVPTMSIESARYSEISIAVSGVGPINRLFLAISAVLAAAAIVVIALTVARLCRKVLNPAPLVPAVSTALFATGAALLVGICGSQVFLLFAQWSVSEHWDGDPTFGSVGWFGSEGWFDSAAATIMFDWTPLIVALLMFFFAGVLSFANRREHA